MNFGVAVCVAMAACMSSTALAQTAQTSTLVGTVSDATGGVLPGATLTVSSPHLIGGSQTVTSDRQGAFRVAQLTPGVYEIAAARGGFRSVTRQNIRLLAGATMTVDLHMEIAGVAGSVNVAGDSPTVDVRSSAAPTNIDDDLLQSLPIRRNLQSVANLTPGITAGVALGGTQNSNAFRVDGVNTSEPALGGNFSAFNYNWVQEAQVVSLGAGAEYGEFTGAVVNAVVRSGGNRVSGLGEYFRVRPNAADRKSNQILADWDGSAQIGGPLIKDRLWFFTGVEYARRVTRPAGFIGPELTTDRAPKFITKVTGAPSPRVRLEGFVEKDSPAQTGEGLGGSFRPEALWTYQNPHTTWHARLAWTINDRTTVEIRHGGYRGFDANEPTPPNTRSGPPSHVDADTGLYSVNVPYFTRFAPKPASLSAMLTHYADGFLGRSHEFKIGAEYERSTARDEFGYPAGRQYYDVGGEADTVVLHDMEIYDPRSTRASFYAQDAWTITDKLTISPGVRLTMNRGSIPGKGRVFSTNPVSPRIGAAWDVTADHKTVIRAHYGRYHDALLNNQFQFMDTGAVPVTIVAAVLGPNRFQEVSRFDPATGVGMDPDITQSFVDQYFLGVEREVFRDLSVRVDGVRRNFTNFMGFVDTRSIYEPVQRQDPGPDGRAGTADDGALLTVFNKTNPGREFFLFTNPAGAFRRYTAFDIVARKRYSRNWQMLASYTRSRTVGNINNRTGSNAGSIVTDAGQRGAFANPNQAINGEGPTAFDYTHEVKISSQYRVPFWQGLNISGIYRYRSGLAWGRTVSIRGLRQGPETIRIEPRGTRRLPALNGLDLRVEKTFHIGSVARTLGVFVDVFNVNNQQIPNSDNRFAVNEASGSRFGAPGPLTDPRTLRIGLRFAF